MKKPILLITLFASLIACNKAQDNTKVKNQNEYDKDARSRNTIGDELIQSSTRKELEKIQKENSPMPKTKENEEWFKRADSLQQKDSF